MLQSRIPLESNAGFPHARKQLGLIRSYSHDRLQPGTCHCRKRARATPRAAHRRLDRRNRPCPRRLVDRAGRLGRLAAALGRRNPAYRPLDSYANAHTLAWSRKVAEAQGYVFVAPQYNWGYPAGLKNALDHVYREWQGKPLVIVTYGGHGGGKCAAQLHQVAEGGLKNARRADDAGPRTVGRHDARKPRTEPGRTLRLEAARSGTGLWTNSCTCCIRGQITPDAVASSRHRRGNARQSKKALSDASAAGLAHGHRRHALASHIQRSR